MQAGNKVIQQLSGKLGQEIRVGQVSSNDIKGAVNSILAAAKGKLEADAVSDIEKKLNQVGGGEPQAAPAQPATDAAPMQEVDTLVNEVPQKQSHPILQQGLVQDLIRRADLQDELETNPLDLAMAVGNAICVFMEKFPSATINHSLEQIVLASHWVCDVYDVRELDIDGQLIYLELEKLRKRVAKPSVSHQQPADQANSGFSLSEGRVKLSGDQIKLLLSHIK